MGQFLKGKRAKELEGCQLFTAMNILGRKWTIPVLQEVDRNGRQGFNYMLRKLHKVSPKVFAERLALLEQNGLVSRVMTTTKNVTRTSYALTEKGRELYLIVSELQAWNSKHGNARCHASECANCQFY